MHTVESLDPGRFDRVLVSGRGGMLDGRASAIPSISVSFVDDLVREVLPWRDAKAFLALKALFRAEKRKAPGNPLIVHTHSSKAGILGRAAAKAAGADLVIHSIHGFGFHDGQLSPVRASYVAAERLASRWTDAFVAVSEENIRTGEKAGIFRRERCRLIRSGFDTGRFLRGSGKEGRRILGIMEGEKVVGTVAVFKPQKAPLDFVETARLVAKEVPGVRFVMVGDGELRPEAERAVAAAGLSGRFTFPGWRGEMPDILCAFDVFLLTSRWEGLPKVVPQAMIAGVPLVATAVDGTKEIVDHGVDGVLAPPGDVPSLARGVIGILSGAPPAADGKQAGAASPGVRPGEDGEGAGAALRGAPGRKGVRRVVPCDCRSLPRRGLRRQLPERGDLAAAARAVDRLPRFPLPLLRQGDPSVGEHPDPVVPVAAGKVRRVRRRDLLAVPLRRNAHRRRVRGDRLACRRRLAGGARSPVLFPAGSRRLHRYRPPDHPRRDFPWRSRRRDPPFVPSGR